MSRSIAQRGAAAVEWIGLVAAAAALMGALTLALPRSVELDDRPPPLISSIAAPVERLGPDRRLPDALNRRFWPYGPYSAGSGDVGRSLARAWATAVAWEDLRGDLERAFYDGFERCLISTLRAHREDPIGQVAELIWPLPVPMPQPAPDDESPGPADGPASPRTPSPVPEAERKLRAYAQKLRGRPPRQVATTISRDAGCLAFEAGLSKGKGLAKKAGRDRLRRRAP